MAIVRVSDLGAAELTHSPFGNEAELESTVSLHPCLLALPQEPDIALVKRQVTLPRAGSLDIFMVNSEGLPIAIEVKLARNSESRREVVGQLVDYASILTSYTVDELDLSVGGALDSALRTFSTDSEDEGVFERRWQAVGANLRAGLARYVIVVDEIPDELERIVRFLVERSNLDIRLVQVQKYPDQSGHVIYVPFNAVERPRLVSIQTEIAADFQAVLDAYQAKSDPAFPMIGQGKTYRIVRPYTWAPALGLHYEFYKISSGITAELHLESDAVRSLSTLLRQYAEQENVDFKYSLRWDLNWSRGRGRLIVALPPGSAPEAIADAMCALIKLTYNRITSTLSSEAEAEPVAPADGANPRVA
jgi:hypothetical protein